MQVLPVFEACAIGLNHVTGEQFLKRDRVLKVSVRPEELPQEGIDKRELLAILTSPDLTFDLCL